MARTRIPPGPAWPAWFYPADPSDPGGIFFKEEEVPQGWTRKRGIPETPIVAPPPEVLDRDELVAKLKEKGITLEHTWGVAHMKRVLDGDISPIG